MWDRAREPFRRALSFRDRRVRGAWQHPASTSQKEWHDGQSPDTVLPCPPALGREQSARGTNTDGRRSASALRRWGLFVPFLLHLCLLFCKRTVRCVSGSGVLRCRWAKCTQCYNNPLGMRRVEEADRLAGVLLRGCRGRELACQPRHRRVGCIGACSQRSARSVGVSGCRCDELRDVQLERAGW